MTAFVDERAPGVSAAMRRRIAAALEAGERPTLRGNNLRLGSVFLQRADGRDAPALREVEIQMTRRALPIAGAFDTFKPGTSRRGRNIYATDIGGQERIIARRLNGENKVTLAGRRFFAQPYSRYIVHVPTVFVRRSTGARFREDGYDVTGEQVGMPVESMNVRGSEQEQLRQLEQAYDSWIASGAADVTIVAPSDYGADVELRVDTTRRPSFDIQTLHVRDGQLTADTFLDRIVFGTPLFAEDMWQSHRLHEVSRRRSGECGIDVIVAAAQQRMLSEGHRGNNPILSADDAAQRLVKLAQQLFPDSPLAQATFNDVPQTAELLGIDEDLRIRAPDLSTLEQFKEGMRHYLAKPRAVKEILKAAEKQAIFRGAHAVQASFAVTLKSAFSWCREPRARLLYFLRSTGFHVEGDQVTLERPIPNALQAIRECGTPVRLLEAYYKSLNVRLVLMNGSRCMQTWDPMDWETRMRFHRTTVILNVWNDHISTYEPMEDTPSPSAQKWRDVSLDMRCDNDFDAEHAYDSMREFDWCEFTDAVHSGQKMVFWTTNPLCELENGLREKRLAFIPRYSGPDRYVAITVLLSDGKRRNCIIIKRVPDNHLELRDFCEVVQTSLKLKLTYKGESSAVVGHRFMREFLVTKRVAVPREKKEQLLQQQENRCRKCNDPFRGKNYEGHHDPPVAEGGTNDNLVLLCRPCHAEETEKQQLKGERAASTFESQLSPDMLQLFQETPRPRQICWGDPRARAEALKQDPFMPISCLDVVGCRKNALLTRRVLPVGSPMDTVTPVFEDNGEYSRPLSDFAWIWVDVPGQHSLFDGPHLYPLETVQVLIEEGFVIPSNETLPFGWAPLRSFPSRELAHAWATLGDCVREMVRLGAGPPIDKKAEDVENDRVSKWAKGMVLSTIGLWSTQERLSWYARATTHDSDMPGPVAVTHQRSDGVVIKMCKQHVYDNTTMLPVALLSLFDEQRRMYRAKQLVARVPQIVPLGCQVDGLFYCGPPEARLELLALCDEERYEHDADAKVFQLKKAAWHQVPFCEQRSSFGRECFKPELRLNWNTLNESAFAQPLDEDALARKMEWDQLIADRSQPPLSDAAFAIIEQILDDEGCLLLGPAGTGKSTILNALKVILGANGHKVRVCAYTHAACRLVGGETVAHLLHLNAALDDTWFLVDEVGLLPVSTLGAMSQWTALGAKFVFFGDFEGQFEPFRDRWNLACNRENPLLHNLCNGLCVKLETYRRGADQTLFDWYHSLYEQEDARGLASQSRLRYPADCDPDSNPLVLCISHNKRIRVNELQNRRLAPAGALECVWEAEEDERPGTTMHPQTMRVWPGIDLIGCPRGSGKQLVVQGVIYTVTGITETHLALQMRPEYCHGADDEKPLVPLEDVCEQLRLCHAMCYYTVQGRTVRDRHIVLLDTENRNFSVRALIVGLSRATHGSFLHVGDDNSEAVFAGARRVVRQRKG